MHAQIKIHGTIARNEIHIDNGIQKPLQQTHITLGGETDNSNPSRLMFSIRIPDLSQNKHIRL